MLIKFGMLSVLSAGTTKTIGDIFTTEKEKAAIRCRFRNSKNWWL